MTDRVKHYLERIEVKRDDGDDQDCVLLTLFPIRFVFVRSRTTKESIIVYGVITLQKCIS